MLAHLTSVGARPARPRNDERRRPGRVTRDVTARSRAIALDIARLRAGGARYRGAKRTIDLLVTLLLLPAVLPLALLAALLVLVTMGRPVLFVQERVGRDGRPFRMFKFRTMTCDAPGPAPAAAVSGDRRVKTAGRILRRYRLDELPQFFNIARGDMSLIGPRPEWTLLHDDYVRHEPAYVYRNLVRPGLTGLAQVRSGYASTLAEARVKLGHDLHYVQNLSMALDLQIAARTLWTLISGHGAR